MRSFAANGYRLRDASREVRLVYSGFLALVVVGLVTLGALQVLQIGATPERIAAYYRGGTTGGEMAFAKTFRELLELTHFHAFVMGLVYLVLAHLFLATDAPAAARRVVVLVSAAALVTDLAAVWLIRYLSAGFAYVQLAAWAAQWVGYAAFVYYPLRDMWIDDGRQTFPAE